MAGFGGLLGYVAGGALEGYGKGIVSDALAVRDAAFREAEAQADQGRLMEREAFQNENLRARDEEERAFRADEGEKNRAVQGRQYGQDSEGNTIIIEGDKSRPVTGPDGKPIRGLKNGSTNQTDFDKKYAIGLELYNGDKKKALDLASGARELSAEKRASLIASIAGQLKPEYEKPGAAQTRLKEAERLVDELLGNSTSRQGTPKVGTTTNEESATPSTADIVKQAQAAIAAGASKDAVRKRLQDNGIDPSLAGL